MTVTSVERLQDTRATRTQGFKRTYVRSYIVTSDDKLEDEVSIYAANGIPLIGDSHPADLGSLLRSKDVDRISLYHWRVTCNYDNENPNEETETAENPLDRPPIFTYGSDKQEIQADTDRDGNKIVNSANFPILGGLKTIRYRHTMQVERVEATFSNAFAMSYKGKVNSDTFAGVEADKVLCDDITCSTFYEANQDGIEIKYYRVTYNFIFDPLGFATKVLSEGRYDASGKRILINGIPVSDPVPLDASGDRASSPSAAQILEFNLLYSASFAGLNIPEDS